jgi:hypothetical protein
MTQGSTSDSELCAARRELQMRAHCAKKYKEEIFTYLLQCVLGKSEAIRSVSVLCRVVLKFDRAETDRIAGWLGGKAKPRKPSPVDRGRGETSTSRDSCHVSGLLPVLNLYRREGEVDVPRSGVL